MKVLPLVIALIIFAPLVSGNTYFYAGSKPLAIKSDYGIELLYQSRLDTDISTKNLPFGQVITNNRRFGFMNKEEDSSGEYYFNARYYDGDSGKFLSKDPVNDQLDYAFVSNNPLNYKDPMGTEYFGSENDVIDGKLVAAYPTEITAGGYAMIRAANYINNQIYAAKHPHSAEFYAWLTTTDSAPTYENYVNEFPYNLQAPWMGDVMKSFQTNQNTVHQNVGEFADAYFHASLAIMGGVEGAARGFNWFQDLSLVPRPPGMAMPMIDNVPLANLLEGKAFVRVAINTRTGEISYLPADVAHYQFAKGDPDVISGIVLFLEDGFNADSVVWQAVVKPASYDTNIENLPKAAQMLDDWIRFSMNNFDEEYEVGISTVVNMPKPE